ncbi:MAG: xanthine dehydrogenase family protein molybdopterin-binding subunit, partial [Chloroflexi bacterium]|nr:xanthine dehydrogenase family protein molybdopterin-binding subunit [Chloroflexota bacterium]
MKKRGTGLAAILYPTGISKGGDASQAIVEVKSDGSVDVLFGSTDLGQGARTVEAQVAAEELGVPFEKIRI